jgi:DNA polymerase V
MMRELNINTRTTGFVSPAESYVDRRLDLNELVINNIHSTFYFRYEGENRLGIRSGNIIVIDRSIVPKVGELVVLYDERGFYIDKFENQKNLWGRISWVLKKQ